MGVFEYVSVLTSIVVGLGIAHLLKGVAGIATTNRHYHAGFALIILIYQVSSGLRIYDTMG